MLLLLLACPSSKGLEETALVEETAVEDSAADCLESLPSLHDTALPITMDANSALQIVSGRKEMMGFGEAFQAGDWNGDGTLDAVVTALQWPESDADRIGETETYLFYDVLKPGREIEEDERIFFDLEGSLLGVTVAVEQGQQQLYIVAGAPLADISGEDAGAVLISAMDGQSSFFLACGQQGDFFGDLLSFMGDNDASTLIVGSPYGNQDVDRGGILFGYQNWWDRSTACSEGFSIVSDQWAGLIDPAVATGDLDGDGVEELVVGSEHFAKSNKEQFVGLVAVFSDPAGVVGWLDGERSLRGEAENDRWGSQVAVADITSDGHLDLLVQSENKVTVLEDPLERFCETRTVAVVEADSESNLGEVLTVGAVASDQALLIGAWRQDHPVGIEVFFTPLQGSWSLEDANLYLEQEGSYWGSTAVQVVDEVSLVG